MTTFILVDEKKSSQNGLTNDFLKREMLDSNESKKVSSEGKSIKRRVSIFSVRREMEEMKRISILTKRSYILIAPDIFLCYFYNKFTVFYH